MGDRDKRNSPADEKPMVQSTVDLYREGEEAMHSPPSPEAAAVGELGRVVELQHAAVAATRAAVARARGPGARQALEAQLREQESLVGAVGELIGKLGGAPPTAGESRGDIPADGDTISYAQDDGAVLDACARNYEYVQSAIDRASAQLPSSLRDAAQKLSERQSRAAAALRAVK